LVVDGPAREVVEEYLAYVNKKDRDRLAEEAARQPRSSASPSTEKDKPARSGTGEIRIKDVILLSEAGEETDVFTSGEQLTIRLVFEASERVEGPVFGVAIHRDDNVHVAGPNTKVSDYRIAVVEGWGELDFVIASLPLAAGHYEISASVYDQTVAHKYDYRHRAFSFSVQPRSAWDKLGVVRLTGDWHLRDSETHVLASKSG
jgi:hypothetical protein